LTFQKGPVNRTPRRLRKSWSIKDRVALAVALLFVVVVGAASTLQIQLLRNDFTQVLSEQQHSLVRRVAHEIDAKFETGVSALAGTAAFIDDTDLANPALLREQFRRRPALMALFDDLIILNPAGTIYVDFPEVAGRVGVDASDRAFFKEVLKTHQTVISEPVIGKTTREPVVQIATPILTRDDRILGVLVGVIRLNRASFLGALGDERIGESGYFVLLTRGKNPVYVVHPDRSRILKPRPANGAAAVAEAIDGFQGEGQGESSRGVDTIYSSQQLKAVPWVLIAAAPKAEVFAPLNAAERRVWIVAGIAAASLVPLAWLLVWFLLGPLRHLRVAMIGMREGEGHFVAVPVSRSDEVGDLTVAFNLLMGQRLEAEKAQREGEARLRLLTDKMPALISLVDADLRVQFANSCYRDWFGLDPEAMVGRRADEIFDTPDYQETMRYLELALAGQSTTHEREVQTGIGKRTVRTVFFPRLESGKVIGIYHMSTDITADRMLHRELDQLARRDPLTGLHNRRSFLEQLPVAIARCARQDRWIALLFVDLDRFKAVNDSLGHEAGDDVLRAVAERLSACVRGIDTVARLGGDEFTVILESLNASGEAGPIAAKIIAAMAEPIATRAGECTIGASIGIAARRGAEARADELLQQADEAAYAAKAAGRGRYHLVE
jgi:diguanylate cyclase (GGDEF)-like protein/PAS domain S-box-containing protein